MSETGLPFLAYGRQCIEDDNVAAVASVLREDRITTGPKVGAFEEAFAARVAARHAVACSSGTAGLHLAALALGLGEGDRVVVPSLTFLATANAVRYAGAEVAFADVDENTGLLNEAGLNGALGGGAKAVFPVHMNGQCVDMEMVERRANEHGMAVVEDACHAIGARCLAADGDPVPVGACRHGHMAVFSLHPVKAIAMGEGGVVTTGDRRLHERLVRLRNHGIDREPKRLQHRELAFGAEGSANPWYYEMDELGLNYRASDIHCALGLSQLAKLDRFLARRRELAERYDRSLAPLAPHVRPVPRVAGCESGWHLYVVLIDFDAVGVDRAALMRRLGERGVGTQVHYTPVHQQPYYRRRYGRLDLPGADRYYARCLSLPLFPAMTDGDVDRVVGALTEALESGEIG